LLSSDGVKRRPDLLDAPITIIPISIDSAAHATQNGVSKMSTVYNTPSTRTALTEHSQSTHSPLTEHSKRTHTPFTAHSETLQTILQTQRTLKPQNCDTCTRTEPILQIQCTPKHESCDTCTRTEPICGKLRHVYENGARERKVATRVRGRSRFVQSCDTCARMERENGKLRHVCENGADSSLQA